MANPDQQRDPQHLDVKPKKLLKHAPKKVALVCMGPSATDYLTKTLTQEFDPYWVDEVWTINMASNPFRCDLVFWMDDLIEQEKFRPKLFVALRKFGMPVITSVARPEVVPNSYDYPIEQICDMAIPVFGKPYLNNGVAMALAYAMLIGVQDLTIYGADFSYPNRDYAESGRACVESWITFAGIKGMNIQLCPSTSLMDSVKDHGIYGYAEQPRVVLSDGRVFQYVKANQVGKYIPEDSSGVKNVSAQPPGTGAGPASPDVSGGAGQHDQAARTPVEAAPGPGEGVQDRTAPGFGHQRAGLALHDSGGKERGFSPAAGGSVPLPARKAKSRRQAAGA